ncbi:MAG: hypothetical protein K5891_06575 [Lachnospiraceae bacterium]|nr:hypothetical protein [Lachnospiraceae bacterium]
MRETWMRILLLAALTVCLGLFAGCGYSAERIVQDLARDYIREKYEITPDVKGVKLNSAGDGGTVTMESEGRIFDVEISIADPSLNGDNYMKKEYAARIDEYFRSRLGCESIYVVAWYGRPGQHLGKDIRTFEDLVAKVDNIQIMVSAYGLDRSSIAGINPADWGADTQIFVADWISRDFVKDERVIWKSTEEADAMSRDSLRSYYHFHDGVLDSLEY